MHYAALVHREAEELATLVGARVRAERRARDWTLDQLAEAAGVSRRQVVNVEQGAANPSLTTLLRLSEALGLGLPGLVAPPPAAPVTITRSGEGAVLWTGDYGGRGTLVAGAEQPEPLELWEWELQPDDRRASEAHLPGTRELLQVREGVLTLEVAHEIHQLTAGDAVSFPGDVPHAYINHSTGPVRYTLVVLEPGASRTEKPHA